MTNGPVTPEPVRVDARGLLCPLPVLRLQKVLRTIEVGQQIELLATDPATTGTFADFCRQSGHRLISARTEGEVTVLMVEKGAQAASEKA